MTKSIAKANIPNMLFFMPSVSAYFEVWTKSQPPSHIGGVSLNVNINELVKDIKNKNIKR